VIVALAMVNVFVLVQTQQAADRYAQAVQAHELPRETGVTYTGCCATVVQVDDGADLGGTGAGGGGTGHP
jgi:hypothetical protein